MPSETIILRISTPGFRALPASCSSSQAPNTAHASSWRRLSTSSSPPSTPRDALRGHACSENWPNSTASAEHGSLNCLLRTAAGCTSPKRNAVRMALQGVGQVWATSLDVRRSGRRPRHVHPVVPSIPETDNSLQPRLRLVCCPKTSASPFRGQGFLGSLTSTLAWRRCWPLARLQGPGQCGTTVGPDGEIGGGGGKKKRGGGLPGWVCRCWSVC